MDQSATLKGWCWVLLLVPALLSAPSREAQAKPKPKPKPPSTAAADHDPLTEWELLNGAAIELRARIRKQPRNDALRQQMADLAVRSAVGAERALAIGDASLFDSYRRQFDEQFHDTRRRIGQMAGKGNAVAGYAMGVLALHGFREALNVETACRHFDAALAKGYPGAKFRASLCLEKTDSARASGLLGEAAASGHPVAAEMVGRACREAKPPDAQCARDRLTIAATAGPPRRAYLPGCTRRAREAGRRIPPGPRASTCRQPRQGMPPPRTM